MHIAFNWRNNLQKRLMTCTWHLSSYFESPFYRYSIIPKKRQWTTLFYVCTGLELLAPGVLVHGLRVFFIQLSFCMGGNSYPHLASWEMLNEKLATAQSWTSASCSQELLNHSGPESGPHGRERALFSSLGRTIVSFSMPKVIAYMLACLRRLRSTECVYWFSI